MMYASDRPLLRSSAALLAGLVFGVGLAIAGMIDPLKVLGFLDLAGAWDASLLFVLAAATGVGTVAFRFVLKRRAPLFDTCFHMPTATAVDRRLVIGAAIFGIGWGLAGYCPGPAIASLGFGNAEALWFLPAMVSGAGLQRWLARRRPPAASDVRPAAAGSRR